MNAYQIVYEFDSEGEPPDVYIAIATGTCIIKVLEHPTCKMGGKMVETNPGCWDWQGEWSGEDEDWEPGPLAKELVDYMNSKGARP